VYIDGLGAAGPDPLKDLQSAIVYLKRMYTAFGQDGAKRLGWIQEYNPPDEAAEFTRQFKEVDRAVQLWLSVATRTLRLQEKDPVKVSEMASDGKKLGKSIFDFNRTIWWKSPTKALVYIKIPFQTAGYVIGRLGSMVVTGGESLVKGLDFGMKNLFPILIGVGVLYLAGPFILKAIAARGGAGKEA
jgi:hypothetical protein